MSFTEVVALDDIVHVTMSYLRGIWRYRWYFLGIAWFVCLVGWGYTYQLPNLYQANARVAIIDPQRDVALFLKSMPGVDITSAARSVLDQLLKRENIVEVVSQLDSTQKLTDEKELEIIAQSVRQSIALVPQKGNTYLLSIKHYDPKLSFQVLQGLMDILKRNSVGSLPAFSSQKAATILQDQIEEFQRQLLVAETELREFKKKHIDLLGDNDADFYQTLKGLQNQLEMEQNKVKELGKKRETLLHQLAERGVAEGTAEMEPDVDQRVVEAKARLAEMQSKYYMKGNAKRFLYPDDHPDVIALRRAIDHMEEQKRKGNTTLSAKELRKMEESNRDKDDPFITKLKMNLADLDVEHSSLTSRIEDVKKRIQTMKELEPQLPTVLSDLEHYRKKVSLLKNNLSSMMNTQGEADISGNIASNLSKLVRFDIVEPPSLPVQPIGPDRKLFFSLTLAGGLVAGLLYAFVLAYLRPVFDSPIHLKQVLGLPVLGTVSMVVEPGFFLGIFPKSSFYWLLILLGVFYGLLMRYLA